MLQSRIYSRQRKCIHVLERISQQVFTLIIAFSKLYLWKMLCTLLLSLYFVMSVTRAFLAVSYDSSRRILTALSRSFVSMTSSLVCPLAVPSSFTSCTILRTLWVNLPTKLLEPETSFALYTIVVCCWRSWLGIRYQLSRLKWLPGFLNAATLLVLTRAVYCC